MKKNKPAFQSVQSIQLIDSFDFISVKLIWISYFDKIQCIFSFKENNRMHIK
jgi:hypothetical protein